MSNQLRNDDLLTAKNLVLATEMISILQFLVSSNSSKQTIKYTLLYEFYCLTFTCSPVPYCAAQLSLSKLGLIKKTVDKPQ